MSSYSFLFTIELLLMNKANCYWIWKVATVFLCYICSHRDCYFRPTFSSLPDFIQISRLYNRLISNHLCFYSNGGHKSRAEGYGINRKICAFSEHYRCCSDRSKPKSSSIGQFYCLASFVKPQPFHGHKR